MAAGVDAGVVSVLPPGVFRTTESGREADFQHSQEIAFKSADNS